MEEESKKRIWILSLFALMGFLLLVPTLIAISIIFLLLIQNGYSVLGVFDHETFGSILIQNTTDYLALIIGLPVTIVISSVALVLAFNAYETARREEKRETHGLIKQRRDSGLERFASLASALNRVFFVSSSIAKRVNDIHRLHMESCDDADHASVDADGIFQEQEYLNRIVALRKSRDESMKSQFLELHDCFVRTVSPIVDEIMSDPLCREFFLGAIEVETEEASVDCLSGLYNFCEMGEEYIESLDSDQVDEVLEMVGILCWSDIRPDTDRETLVNHLIPPERLCGSGLALLSILFPPVVSTRPIEEIDYRRESARLKRSFKYVESNHPHFDEEILESYYVKSDIESCEWDYMASENLYIGPLVVSWLFTRFPTATQLQRLINDFFVDQVPKKAVSRVVDETGKFKMVSPG